MLGLSAHVSFAVAAMSLAVIILILRDTRFRINQRVLALLLAFVALGLWAVIVFVDVLRMGIGQY